MYVVKSYFPELPPITTDVSGFDFSSINAENIQTAANTAEQGQNIFEKVGGWFSSGKKYNQAVVDIALQLVKSRDEALLSGSLALATAHNNAVKAADAQFNNIKDEEKSLNGKRLSNFRIIDENGKDVGLDSSASTDPKKWWSEASSAGGIAPVTITNDSQKAGISAKNTTLLNTNPVKSINTTATTAATSNKYLPYIIGVVVFIVLLIIVVVVIKRRS